MGPNTEPCGTPDARPCRGRGEDADLKRPGFGLKENLSIQQFGVGPSQRSNAKSYVTSGCQCLENLCQFKAFTERSS